MTDGFHLVGELFEVSPNVKSARECLASLILIMFKTDAFLFNLQEA